VIDVRAIRKEYIGNGASVFVEAIGLKCDFFTEGEV